MSLATTRSTESCRLARHLLQCPEEGERQEPNATPNKLRSWVDVRSIAVDEILRPPTVALAQDEEQCVRNMDTHSSLLRFHRPSGGATGAPSRSRGKQKSAKARHHHCWLVAKQRYHRCFRHRTLSYRAQHTVPLTGKRLKETIAIGSRNDGTKTDGKYEERLRSVVPLRSLPRRNKAWVYLWMIKTHKTNLHQGRVETFLANMKA